MTLLAWMTQGGRRGEDPGLIFPVGQIGPSLHQVEQVRAVCRRCPVLATCLRYAMDTRPPGIWEQPPTTSAARCAERHGAITRAVRWREPGHEPAPDPA